MMRVIDRDELLGQLLIAVGRVQVLEGQPVSSFEGLPRLVSMVVDDHEDLEGRIQAVVEYLRGAADRGPSGRQRDDQGGVGE